MFKVLQAAPIALIFLTPVCSYTAEAENAFIIKNWSADEASPENSLPQSSVIAMTLRHDGYLWLGTRNGLVRFDGVRFTVFDQHNTPGLNSSSIVHLFEDSQTNLWIGTEIGGVALLKPDGQVRSLDIGRGSVQSRLVSACEDSAGAVWLYTANGLLCRYQKGQGDIWEFGAQYPSNCRKIVAEQLTLRVGTDWGLYSLGPTTNTVQHELPPLQQMIPFLRGKMDFLLASKRGGHWQIAENRIQHWMGNRMDRDLGSYPWNTNAHVSAACEDRDGNLIVGTLSVNDGVYWFGSDGRTSHIWHEQGLSHDGILSLCVDRENALWVGTDGGGLNRVVRKKFSVASLGGNENVQSISADSKGRLWAGIAGGGVKYFDNGEVKELGRDEGLTNVWSVFADRNDRVWVGTAKGLFQFAANQFTQWTGVAATYAIHQDRKGHLWFGTQTNVVRFDGRDWKSFPSKETAGAAVRTIADDAEGNVWLGTLGAGLVRFRDEKFTTFSRKDGLPSEDISSVLVDHGGALWIGTLGGGIATLRGDKVKSISKSDGLISNSIGYLIEDEDSLWMGSNLGLMRVTKKALNDFLSESAAPIPCRTYTKEDGLPTSECTQGSQPAAVRSADNKLWFATVKGLVTVDCAQLKQNSFAPPVAIESAIVDGHAVNTNLLRIGALREVVMRPGQQRLEILYTSLNIAAPNRTRFKFRLENHDRGWTEDVNNSRVARYPKLPSGKYTFRVIAANEDNVWNESGASLAVLVLPPFWRTWWFSTITAMFVVGMIVAVVYFISTQRLHRQLELLRNQEAIGKERSRIARDLHDQLGANLTQVALLGELAEADRNLPEEVQSHARQISETARETTLALDEIVWAANPSNDTLEGLVNYACKYAQEFFSVAGLRYRLNVPDTLPHASLAPEVRHNVFLAFKEAVNNIVRHAGATEVCVRLKLQAREFTLEIEDNGRGIKPGREKPERNGMRNMRKRMQDTRGEFFIGNAESNGTVVRLTAPLEKTN
jgi:signal transduction histidine kinase/ligand-binding sensor domain-containing protein